MVFMLEPRSCRIPLHVFLRDPPTSYQNSATSSVFFEARCREVY